VKSVQEVAADAAIRAGEVYPPPERKSSFVISQAHDDFNYADAYRGAGAGEQMIRDKPVERNVSVSRIVRKQALYASVIRACGACGAPGYWHNTPGVNIGCYAPDKVTQLGADPVGPVCPNCGAARETIEPHGQIWSKVWRVSLWRVLCETLRDLFNPVRRWRKQ